MRGYRLLPGLALLLAAITITGCSDRGKVPHGVIRVLGKIVPRKEYTQDQTNFRKVLWNEITRLAKQHAASQLEQSYRLSDHGQYDRAISIAMEAFQEYDDCRCYKGRANALDQLGKCYWTLKDVKKAEYYYHQALALRRVMEPTPQLASTLDHLGKYYLDYGNDRYRALNFFNLALTTALMTKADTAQADALYDMGRYYLIDNMPVQADSAVQSAIRIYRNHNNDNQVGMCLVMLGRVRQAQHRYNEANAFFNQALIVAKKLRDRSILEQAYLSVSELAKQTGNRMHQLEYYKRYSELRDSLLNLNMLYNISDLETDYAVQKKQREKERTILYSLGVLMLLSSLSVVVVMREKRRSEKLLLNILPKKVAVELKRFGSSRPQSFPNVTVMLSDFAGFTSMSSTLEPEELISKLTEIYTAFDHITETYGCERIKTTGDAYLAVCGLPDACQNHAKNMVNAALKMLEYMHQHNEQTGLHWQIRIGIHTGKVVGGIVGIKKYIYDVFGDTINTTSRMENNSESMRINISQQVYDLICDDFICEPRPQKDVKGKGMMQMYFVNGAKVRTPSPAAPTPPIKKTA